MKYELREITTEWINPHHDKRHKYGAQAIASLPVGTRLIAHQSETIADTHIDVLDRSKFYCYGPQAQTIISHSKLVEPATWHEWCAREAGDQCYYASRGDDAEILEVLWDKGEPCRQLIQDVFREINADMYNAET